MRLCDDGHEEVCYEGTGCPVCALKDEKKDLEEEVAKLEAQLKEANEQS